MACPDPFVLAAGADPSSPDRAGVLAHAADCGACRAALADLLAALEGAPQTTAGAERAGLKALKGGSRLWIPLSAAAALLLAVGLFHRDAPQRPPETPALPAPAIPDDREVSLVLGRASALTLKPGSRAQVTAEGVTLLEGALWLEDPGEPLTLQAGGSKVEVTQATLLLEMGASPKVSFWLQEALASEGGARLVVLTGSARVKGTEVKAGEEMLLESGVVRPASALAWRGDEGWKGWEGLPLRLKEGAHPLAPEALQDGYVWEALVRRLNPEAALGLRFAAGGKGWQVPLGAPGAGALVRVRVEVRGGWVRLQAGGTEILRRPVEALQGKGGLDPAEARCGLRVWGGELEVVEARWKEGL